MSKKIKKEKAESYMKKFFSDFGKFISRGNVMDLAVAVVIGGAFTAIVNGLVKFIIMPLIDSIMPANALNELILVLKPAIMDADGVTVLKAAVELKWGEFLQAIINFLIIAIVVFCLVRIIMRIKKTLDIDAQLTEIVQKKLDADEELNNIEERWLKRKLKKDPKNAPKKTVIEPKKVEEPIISSTDKLLMDILLEIKRNKSVKNDDKPETF